MCAIGRGIMARPKLLIIDELSLGLAPTVVETLAESLPKIRAQNISILLVEQDVATAFEISDYGYVLDSGRVSMHGASRELLENAAVRDAYLGM
jgi:branched-chain amino acid transport system ATP-binding protein